MNAPLPGTATRRLLEQYLDEHLADAPGTEPALVPAPPAPAESERYVHFRVGPFQFVLASAALADAPARGTPVSARELVPARYRDRVESGMLGPDVLVLKGGRIEIAGCLRVGELDIPHTAIAARGLRPDTPWILGSLQQPPSFVLDPDALQLHFARRA